MMVKECSARASVDVPFFQKVRILLHLTLCLVLASMDDGCMAHGCSGEL